MTGVRNENGEEIGETQTKKSLGIEKLAAEHLGEENSKREIEDRKMPREKRENR